MNHIVIIVIISMIPSTAVHVSCEDSPLLEMGHKHRDMFELLRKVPVIDRGRGLFSVRADFWNYNDAQVHYSAALNAYEAASRDADTAPCAYRESVRLLLYNRYHMTTWPGMRDIRKALDVSLDYRNRFPDDHWAWLLRGLVLYMDGGILDAWSQFERAMSLMENGAWEFRQALPTDLSDPYLSTSVNEAETAAWARAVYADIYYPGWRENNHPDKITPGTYIVSFGIPALYEYRVRAFKTTHSGLPRPEQLFITSGGQTVIFEDPFRTRDWDVSVRSEIDAADRLRLEGFAFIDLRKEIGIFHSYARFREPDGSTLLAHSFGLPFPESQPPGALPGDLRLGTLVLGEDGSVLESILQHYTEMDTGQMWPVDTMRVWTRTHLVSIGSNQKVVASEAISKTWFNRSQETVLPLKDTGLAVSDIVLAHNVLEEEVHDQFRSPGMIFRNGYTITPQSMPLIEQGAMAPVYFEVYGLKRDPEGTGRFDIQADVTPEGGRGVLGRLFGREPDGVGLRLQWETPSESDGVYISLDTRSLDTGPAQLTVRITDRSTGESVTAERRVEIY